MKSLYLNILQIINGEDGVTYLQLIKRLENKDVKFSWKELKLALIDLEEKRLIEERHFNDGRVDYSMEPEGYEFLKNLNHK